MINGGMPETPDAWIERNPLDEFWPIEEEEQEEIIAIRNQEKTERS